MIELNKINMTQTVGMERVHKRFLSIKTRGSELMFLRDHETREHDGLRDERRKSIVKFFGICVSGKISEVV